MNKQEAFEYTRAVEQMGNSITANWGEPGYRDFREIQTDLDSLRRIGKWLDRHNERVCSDERYCQELDKWERLASKKEARARAILAQYPGLAVDFQGDPRGCALVIYREDGAPYEYGRQPQVFSV